MRGTRKESTSTKKKETLRKESGKENKGRLNINKPKLGWSSSLEKSPNLSRHIEPMLLFPTEVATLMWLGTRLLVKYGIIQT